MTAAAILDLYFYVSNERICVKFGMSIHTDHVTDMRVIKLQNSILHVVIFKCDYYC